MSGVTVALNSIQKLPGVGIIQNTTVTPAVFYTCPAGKKAKIKGEVRCVDRGAAANSSFEGGGVVLAIWVTAAAQLSVAQTFLDTPESLTTSGGGKVYPFEVILAAGETIRGIQNSGSNSQFKINANVEETPV